MDSAVQSPPIEDADVGNALDRAIKSKERKRPDGMARNLCLVLLNALDSGSQSKVGRKQT